MIRKMRFNLVLIVHLSMVVASLFTVHVLGGLAEAQAASTGAISGVETDPKAGVVSGVTIRVTSKARGETREVTSQSNGSFLGSLLVPGAYAVEATKENFKKEQFNEAVVAVSETNSLNVRLEDGQNTEVVTVYAEENQLQTTSSACLRVTVEASIRAKELKVPTFGITDSEKSPIARVCANSCLVSVASPSFVGSYVAPMAMLGMARVAATHLQTAPSLQILKRSEQQDRSGHRWYRGVEDFPNTGE